MRSDKRSFDSVFQCYTYDLYGVNYDGTKRSCIYLDRRAAGVRTSDLICIPWCKQSYTYTDYA